MQLTLQTLSAALLAIGRAVVFRSDYWDGATALSLDHLGDTEGDIRLVPNDSYVHLTAPELTGPAKLESYIEGEDPTVEIPLFLADPALRAVISPTGTAGAGHSRRRKVAKHTLVLFPEELFAEANGEYGDLSYTDANGWRLGGDALTDEQERLLGLSVWLWRGYFTRAPIPFRHADGGKALDTVTFQAMLDSSKPEGNMLYTIGDPAAAAIDIDPTP
jgi:hypothetical protein